MFSHPLIELTDAVQGKTLEEFLDEHPEPWLVLEEGPRLPPRGADQTLSMPRVSPGPRVGLATAFALAFDKPYISVGRDVESDVCIADAALSRAHFVLFRSEGQWSVRDARSTNGTSLDGRKLLPIQHNQLWDGSLLQAGHLQMHFYEPEGMYRRLLAEPRPSTPKREASPARGSVAAKAHRPDSSPPR